MKTPITKNRAVLSTENAAAETSPKRVLVRALKAVELDGEIVEPGRTFHIPKSRLKEFGDSVEVTHE